jgi:hypothetical protein
MFGVGVGGGFEYAQLSRGLDDEATKGEATRPERSVGSAV